MPAFFFLPFLCPFAPSLPALRPLLSAFTHQPRAAIACSFSGSPSPLGLAAACGNRQDSCLIPQRPLAVGQTLLAFLRVNFFRAFCREKEKKRITSIQPRGHDEMLTDK
jgi:hypothetical protein